MLKLDSLSSVVGFQNCKRFNSTRVFSTNGLGLASNLSSLGKRFSLKCLQSEYSEQQSITASSQSRARANAAATKVLVGHSIHKQKGVLTVAPVAPEFTALDSGAMKLSKEGFVALQFAPATHSDVYDWSRKQVFALSVTEIASVVSLGAKDSCAFHHDPFRGKSDEGKVWKLLKVEPLPDRSGGYFFNISVKNKLVDVNENISIPVTRAEFAVLKSVLNFILPHLLGWHAFANSVKPEDMSRIKTAARRRFRMTEWSR